MHTWSLDLKTLAVSRPRWLEAPLSAHPCSLASASTLGTSQASRPRHDSREDWDLASSLATHPSWWSQGSAARSTTHCSEEWRLAQQWIEQHCPDFIKKDEWQSNSPDPNPLDYHVWGAMLEKYQAYSPKPTHKDALKVVLQAIWDNLPQEPSDRESRRASDRRAVTADDHQHNRLFSGPPNYTKEWCTDLLQAWYSFLEVISKLR